MMKLHLNITVIKISAKLNTERSLCSTAVYKLWNSQQSKSNFRVH